MAIWHHPCAAALIHFGHRSEWPVEALCAEALIELQGKQTFFGDSGGGVVRCDSTKKKCSMVGVISQGVRLGPVDWKTILVAPADTFLTLREWMDKINEGL